MRAYDIIKKKRDGAELNKEEIGFLVNGYVSGDIPDYQISAFLMAVFFRGMTDKETAFLTFAIRDSGAKPDFSDVKGIRADKHSTGGVGDKTSLVVAPIVASCGVTVAKMSGRGLGHTGGTVDKLESIDGFNASLSEEEFKKAVKKTGLAITGQSGDLAPADKLLYALRDVTATVDSIPLIASSIMGKKLAAGDDCIVLDVKVGSGAFMKTEEEGKKLALAMVDIGKKAGKKTVAFLTDMDEPLGYAIGNALEVKEAAEALQGKGEKRFAELCVALSKEMLFLAGKGTPDECEKMVNEVISSGKALEKFAETVETQGGDKELIYHPEKIKTSKYSKELKAWDDGIIEGMNAENYGVAAMTLGAGRNKKEDKIDYGAGILLKKKVGESVKNGETIAVIFSSGKSKFAQAEEIIKNSTIIGKNAANKKDIILEIIE